MRPTNPWAYLLIAALLTGCATTASDERQSASEPAAEAAPERSSPPPRSRPLDAEASRRQDLYIMIFRQIEPCLKEQVDKVADPSAAGPVVVQFGFEPSGEVVTAQLPPGGEARYAEDAAYREIVNALILGVQGCSPLADMPAAEHTDWGLFPLIFRPEEV